MARFTGILLVMLGVVCLFAAPIAAAQSPTPTEEPALAGEATLVSEATRTPGMFPLPPGIDAGTAANDRLAPPPMPENPTQADLGAQAYYQVCMVCHGDRGQGLTDEWRGALDPEDQDCWQSGCHNNRHPEGGFIFPKVVPPVAGAGVLSHYPTALHLHDFIQTRMPWQARGTRSEDEYWQLTAFLLRINGLDPGTEPLDAKRAAQIVLNPSQATALAQPASMPEPPAEPHSNSISMRNLLEIAATALGLGLAAFLIVIGMKRGKTG